VDITVSAPARVDVNVALRAAFAAVAELHVRMSFQQSDSDIGQINRTPPGKPVPVHPDTFEVLEAALGLYRASAGRFDCTARTRGDGGARDAGFVLDETNHTVTRQDARMLDVSGIAKGYAVDRAIDVLQTYPIASALVNAGGDMRHAGEGSVQIHLRDPMDFTRLVQTVTLGNRALASSASVRFGLDEPYPQATLFDSTGRSTRALPPGMGACVAARQCMWADALTKVALVGPVPDVAFFAAYDADLVMLHAGSSEREA
jgi:thiamine biosynthesis lipoprotein